MPSLKITLAQSPVLLDPLYNVKGRAVVVGTITVTTSKPLTIGGLRLIWSTRAHQRVKDEKHPSKIRWDKGRVIDHSETMVLETEQVVPAGANQYEFVMDIPVDTLDTRTTHFDKVRHTLSAGLLSASPCYDDLYPSDSPRSSIDSGSRRPSAVSLLRAIRHAAKTSAVSQQTKTNDSEEGFESLPVLTTTSMEVPVFRTACTVENDSAYRYAFQGPVAGLGGQFSYSLTSPNFALGGLIDVDISLKDLPRDATVHSVQLALKQTTTAAPSPDDASPSRAIDEYTLWEEGSAGYSFGNRPRPLPNSYVWRGAAGRALDHLPSGSSLDLPYPRIRRTVHLPSPIIGALPTRNDMTTLSSCASSTASVSHLVTLEILYSVLGVGSFGVPLPPGSDRRPVEGVLRSWKLEKEVIIANDTRTSGQMAPPGYCSSSREISMMPTDMSPIMPSAGIRWRTSYGSGSDYLRSVLWDAKETRRRTMLHFEETEGLCECFSQRAIVEPRDWSADAIEERIDHRCKV